VFSEKATLSVRVTQILASAVRKGQNMAKVQTVLGPVAPRDLGTTMMHEHLIPETFLDPAPRPVGEHVGPPPGEPYFPAHDVAFLVRQLTEARDRHGLQTVVDCTPAPRRKVVALRQIAEATGLNIVASTGSFKDVHMTAFVRQASVQELTGYFVRELTEGIDGSGIRAGIIKVGSSMRRITDAEEKLIRAAARAHYQTGAAITTHATVGTMGREQVQLLEDEKVDVGRVVIGHSDLNTNPDYHEGIVRRGATVGFDTIGKERFVYVRTKTAGCERYEFEQEAYFVPDWQRRAILLELVRRGHAGRIVLSSDLTRNEALQNPATHGSWGYGYLLGWFVPTLIKAGVADGDIRRMLVDNPRRVLAGA
jgi:predicted metal-dependent phosphotriesterase family hydrolase